MIAARRLQLLVLVACVVIGAGCSARDEASGSAGHAPRPRAYHPERFPDIPLPPGYSLAPDADQLAVVYGGGLVRRFEVTVIERKDVREAQSPADLLTWYARVLPGLGWTATTSGRWRRSNGGVAEELQVAAERSGGRTRAMIRLHSPAGT